MLVIVLKNTFFKLMINSANEKFTETNQTSKK